VAGKRDTSGKSPEKKRGKGPGNKAGKKSNAVKKPSRASTKKPEPVKKTGKRGPYDDVPTEVKDASPAAKTPDIPDDVDAGARERGDIPMSLVGHLDEFRSRFLFSLISILVITLLSFFFSDQLLYVINRPYLSTGLKLNVFNLIDGFLLRLKASLIAGLLLGFPVIVYELWKYIAPAIDRKDRRFAGLAVIIAVFLFYLGIALTYLALPMAINALLSFTPPGMNNMINASDYLSLVMIFCLAIGAIFELPIVILILTKIGVLSPSFLISKRKWAYVLIWILAAVITPTVDPLTQSMVAIPLMLLYEISIVISKVVVIRKKKRELREAS
jgi:sec-independent protein translocase protein TatC